MNEKILIADDEHRMRRIVGDFLKHEGYDVIEAEDGKEAIDIFISKKDIDLIILDVMMPNIDGWTVCKEIRKISRIPVLMLTARNQEFDELYGFESGADDYIAKPFNPKILVARVNALLRRNKKKNTDNLNGLNINYDAHSVTVDNKEIDLTPKEYELLVYLYENRGSVLGRDQILDRVWGFDYFGSYRTVDTHVNRLRVKLDKKGRLINTIHGYGYKFEVQDENINKD